MPSDNERRRHRSDNTNIALSLQLLASQQRLGAKSVVLADHHGRVIARSNDSPVAEEVVSFGPVLARPTTWNGRVRYSGRRLAVTIARVPLGKQNGYICSLGASANNPDAELIAAGRGIRRILNR